jgi:futalosine hydrolase
MNDRSHILVVAATEHELAPADGWRTFACGVGPVDAAARTAEAIAALRPAAVLHVGIAGARRAAGLAPGTVVIGSESRYCDLAVAPSFAPGRIAPSALLLGTAVRVLPDAPTLPIGTSGRVGGSSACASEVMVEAMEGFAVLRAADLAGVPAIEIRAISNEIEEPDRALWHFERAFAAVRDITPQLVEEFAQCVN